MAQKIHQILSTSLLPIVQSLQFSVWPIKKFPPDLEAIAFDSDGDILTIA